MENIEKVEVSNLLITPFNSITSAVEAIIKDGRVCEGFAIAVNAEKIISARDDIAVFAILQSASLLYADGISVVKTVKQKGVSNVRIPGCELWLELMIEAAKLDKSVLLIGASENTNKKAAERLQKKFGLKRIQRINGYFKKEEVIQKICSFKPEIVTVALGSPKQEQLINKLREVHPSAFYMGVGGTYDVFCGNVNRAPLVFRKLHMEWLYRLIRQPKRIFRQFSLFRYFWLHMLRKL